MRICLTCIGVVVMLFLGVHPAIAQSHSFAISTGIFNFDLSGTGNSPLLAGSIDWKATRNWVIEGGLTMAFPDQQFGDRTTFLIPEALIQYQWPERKVSPFVGGGIGAAVDVRDRQFGGTRTDLALAAGAGLRINLTDLFGMRAEFRLRGFGTDFSGSAAEVRGGVFWRF